MNPFKNDFLKGMKIIELDGYLPSSLLCKMLGDCGAQIIRIYNQNNEIMKNLNMYI